LTPVIILFLLGSALFDQERAQLAPAGAPWQIRITERDEPGVPLRITGSVMDDAGNPVSNASLYVYQTDARGYYTPDNARADQAARIHGWLRSDRQGRFEVTTIRPGSYPGTRNPQHVHFVVNARGFSERVFEIVFEDDAYVDARVRAEASRPNSVFSICTPVKEGNLLHCAERIVLQR
jgi:protocatechuate 3,4-dioxygenase beta subunit